MGTRSSNGFVAHWSPRLEDRHETSSVEMLRPAGRAVPISIRADGAIVGWSATAAELFGWSREQAVGRRLADLIIPERFRDAQQRALEQLLATGERRAVGRRMELSGVCRDGRELPVELTITPMGANGAPVFNGSLHDISARRGAEVESRRLAAIVAASRDAILSGTVDGVIESWNAGAERLYGYTAQEMIGRSTGLLRPTGDLTDVADVQRRLLAGESISDFETREVRKDGTLIDVSVSLSPLQDERGRVIGISSIARNIGTRKAAEASLREHAERLSGLARAEAARPAVALDAGVPEDAGSLSPRARARVDSILALARRQLGMEVAFLGEMRDGRESFHAISGDASSFGLAEGAELPLSETYCQRMVHGRIPNIVADAAAEPEVAALAVTRDGNIGAYVGVPLRLSDGTLYGALCGLGHGPRDDLSERHVELLRFLGDLVVEALEHNDIEERERRAELELSSVRALLAALEARDHYTSEHSKTVVELATAVARRLGFDETDLSAVEQVAILHDIGKVGIPDAVLQKPGPLSEQEWVLMRQHPAVGARIVASIESLAHLAPAVHAEHERYDGGGYPDGLAGEQIPIASRITLACDAYHAMTSHRPYRAALPAAEARTQLADNAGSQFDPAVVTALLDAVR